MPPAQSVQGAFRVNNHVSNVRNSLSCTSVCFDLMLCTNILFINFAHLDQR